MTTPQAADRELEDRVSIQLDTIARTIENWLQWDSDGRARENLTTEDGTYIMSLPVPYWPTHSMFRNWIAVMREASALSRLAHSGPVVGEGIDAG